MDQAEGLRRLDGSRRRPGCRERRTLQAPAATWVEPAPDRSAGEETSRRPKGLGISGLAKEEFCEATYVAGVHTDAELPPGATTASYDDSARPPVPIVGLRPAKPADQAERIQDDLDDILDAGLHQGQDVGDGIRHLSVRAGVDIGADRVATRSQVPPELYC